MSEKRRMQIDQIVRSKRKTIALVVGRDGRLVVRAPMRISRWKIEATVAEHAEWIRARQEEIQAERAAAPAKAFVEGESFWYLGKLYRLEIVEQAGTALELDGNFRLRRTDLGKGKAVFEGWYRERAREVLGERLAFFAQKTGLQGQRLRISSARTRWGSCSSRGTLSFTWRLMMAPVEAIDYVVVHELAHLVERNHSKKFWARVKEMMPDYRQRRDWLKKNGHILNFE